MPQEQRPCVFRRLQEKLAEFIGIPEFSDELTAWHGELRQAIVSRYGDASDEFDMFSSIKLEMPPELLTEAEAQIRKRIPGQENKQDIKDLVNLTGPDFLRKRLLEFDELITGCMLKKRNQDC